MSADRRRPPAVPYLLNTNRADGAPGPLQGSPLAFAHRGAYLRAENTHAAFAQAVEAGFQYIETDVRTAACGTLVVFHDESLDRVTTGSGAISEHTWQELQKVRVLPAERGLGALITGTAPAENNHGADGSDAVGRTDEGEPLMTFDQLLEAFPRTNFNVDLKDAAAVEPFCEAVDRYQAWDRVLAASFNDSRRQQVMRRLGRRIAASTGMAATALMVLLGPLGLAGKLAGRFTDVDCLQVPVKQFGITVVRPAFLARAHRAGLQVHVWVVDEPAEMHRLLDMGVDGIMTDDAAALASVMTERGHWPQRQAD